MRKYISSLMLVFGIISCTGHKFITGKYATNFASLGFFGTTIILNQDRTFDYKFSGDLIYHHLTGTYKISKGKLYSLFDKEDVDSNLASRPLIGDSVEILIRHYDTIKYQQIFYLGHNKLFFTNKETKKKITRENRYNKRKKYILFGRHHYKKRHYLRLISK